MNPDIAESGEFPSPEGLIAAIAAKAAHSSPRGIAMLNLAD
jgi:hypothetical protein